MTVDTNESVVPSYQALFIPYRLKVKEDGE